MGLPMPPHSYGRVYASPQIWTCLCLSTDMGLSKPPHRYGPVYASPQIWTCLCLPTDMGLSMPLNRYGPVYASPQILVCVCLPVTRPTFIFLGKSHNFVKFRMMNFGELPLNASEPFCANGTISNDLTISRQTWPTNKKYLGEQVRQPQNTV